LSKFRRNIEPTVLPNFIQGCQIFLGQNIPK
jgi:hypothetical protein